MTYRTPQDENGNFISTSCVSRREQEFFYYNLVFREGGENLKIISHGRARKNEPKSHENSRDREFSLCSATLVAFVGIHSALCFPVAKLSPWPAGGLNSTAPCFKPLRNLEILKFPKWWPWLPFSQTRIAIQTDCWKDGNKIKRTSWTWPLKNKSKNFWWSR